MKLLAFATLTVLALSGCLGVEPDEDHDQTSGDDTKQDVRTGPTVLTGTDTRTQRLGPSIAPNRNEVAAWDLSYSAVLLDLEATLTWLNGTNRFTLEVETPSGATERFPAASDVNNKETIANVDDLAGGAYRFLVVVSGVQTPDTVTLQVSYKRVEAGSVEGLEGQTELPVKTYQEGGKWLATISYSATGDVGDHAEADVHGANGVVNVGAATDTAAVLNMVAWARADTERDAVERVRAIEVALRVADDRIEGSANVEQWNNRGLHVGLYVPQGTSLGGLVDSSNGPVDVEGVVVDGLTISSSNGGMEFHDITATDLEGDTSNGPISGEVRASGSATFGTSNGAVDLTIRPTDDLELVIDTSNGPIDLALEERSDVAYDLDVDTSNGRIEVDMEDADYDGDRTGGTVRTRNGEGRAVQVTGTVGTSNGSVSIDGA